jgi:hypothetical protein
MILGEYQYVSDKVKRVKSPGEVAAELGVHVDTIYAWIKAGLFTKEEYVVIKRLERSRYVFFDWAVESFLARQKANMRSEERPKRTYNRRVVKGKHKKKRIAKKST